MEFDDLDVAIAELQPVRDARGNGVAIYIDARQMRDRAFDRPQALAKVLVDCGTE